MTRRPDDTPSRVLADGHHVELLRRCLAGGTEMPLDVRVAGGLILPYGLRASKVASLTADRLAADEAGTYLAIDKVPVLLPPNLTRLVEQLLARPHHRLGRATRFLFPGRPSTEPIAATSLAARLRRHGIPAGAARDTALMTLAADLPARVIADLLGWLRRPPPRGASTPKPTGRRTSTADRAFDPRTPLGPRPAMIDSQPDPMEISGRCRG